MLKNHFPMRVVAYDADGVQRNVACLQDILDLAKEKAERYADPECERFVKEATNFLTPIKVKGEVKQVEAGSLTLPPGVKVNVITKSSGATPPAKPAAKAPAPKGKGKK